MTKNEMERIVDEYCCARNECAGCVLNNAELGCEPTGEDLERAVCLIEEERESS